jgi:hypothetical protein
MWDLAVPGNNDHDFYILPAQTGSHHAYDVVAGNTPILVHNCGNEDEAVAAQAVAQDLQGTSGNAIQGIADDNPLRSAYMNAARRAFGLP